jgi:hypothetical protein
MMLYIGTIGDFTVIDNFLLNLGASGRCAAGPGYTLVSFVRHLVTGKRIPLLSLARAHFMRDPSGEPVYLFPVM